MELNLPTLVVGIGVNLYFHEQRILEIIRINVRDPLLYAEGKLATVLKLIKSKDYMYQFKTSVF